MRRRRKVPAADQTGVSAGFRLIYGDIGSYLRELRSGQVRPPGIRRRLDCQRLQSHGWVAMQIATKFLRLTKPVALGDHIDGWRVCWVGGWDRCRVLFVVMVERQEPRVSAGLRR